MASFSYTVDTEPMAKEIHSVSRHVNITTGAVVAMQTAVVLAEESAAEHVCNNVNKGFYSLIRSQISQKMAKLQSEVDSHLMQLVQQKNAILNIKTRMQRDYNMIAKRYGKLFNGLNANLKQRVFELDKPTIDFAVREVDKIANRSKYLTATVPVNQVESVSLSQRIISSNVKLRGLNVIKSMSSFLSEMEAQKRLTDQILITDNRNPSNASSFMPVLIYECNHDPSGERNFEVVVTDTQLDTIAKSAVKNMAYSKLSTLNWSPAQNPDATVKVEFSNLLAKSNQSQRVKDMAKDLFQKSSFQTI